MKRRSLLGIAFVCGLALTGCSGHSNAKDASSESTGGASKDGKQVFNLVVNQEMPSADLSMATDTISFTALNNVDEGLYRLDKDNKPQPAGATEEAKVSEDGLTYDFKLREDSKWSNGDPVTAADYVYAWQRTVDPATGSQYAYLYAPVKNAQSIIDGKMDKGQLGIEAVNDHELKITLETATPYFDYLLAFPTFFPQNQKVVEKEGNKYAQKSENAVYNGPFVLDKFDGPGTDTEWVYTKNETYWDKKNVKLDTINVSVVKEASTGLNMFQDGQADDVILSGELAQQNANEKEYAVDKESRTTFIELNQRKEDSPFRNENLRKALSYAIDRKALVKQILGDGSVESKNLIPADMSKNPDTGADFIDDSTTKMVYDKAKAKEYWKKAKEELGIDKLSFTLLADDTDVVKKVGEYVQGTWKETFDGMDVKLATVPFTVRLDRGTSGDFEVLLSGWGADYSDPSTFTDLFVTGNSYNRGRWSNPDYDALVKKAATADANDPSARWKDLLEAEELVDKEAGMIPVYQKAEGHMRAEKVKGVVLHGAGAKYDYKWVHIEE